MEFITGFLFFWAGISFLIEKMSAVAINHLFGLPETIEKLIFPSSGSGSGNENRGGSNNIPIDILESPKEYIFYLDIPGISKSDIQVMFKFLKIRVFTIWGLFGFAIKGRV